MRLRPPHEELRIEGDAPGRRRIELHHPALDALRIELRIDRTVKRVREVDAPPIPADLDHLRTTAERARPRGMLGARDDAADAHLAGELRGERIGHVVLLQVAGAPAG